MSSTINYIFKIAGTSYTVVANYSALPDPTTVSGKLYWVSNNQGSWWLPGSLGGTYYGKGMYYSNGTTWETAPVPFQATELEVIAGINNNKFVTPLTLKVIADTKAVLGDQRTVVPVAGEYVNVTLGNNNGVVVSANTLYYVGLTFLKDCFVHSVQIVSGSTSGNGDLKFGVYNSDSNLKPGTKNSECTISVVGTGAVQTGVFSAPVAISKGLHWFTFARGTNGELVTTYGISTPTSGNALENRGGVGDNASRNGSYGVGNNPNNNLPSTVTTHINAGIVMPKFALLISSVS